MIIDIGNVIKRLPNKIQKLAPSLKFLIVINVSRRSKYYNWNKKRHYNNKLNKFISLDLQGKIAQKSKIIRTNVGDDSKKIKKTVRVVVEKLIPKNKRSKRN